MKCPECQQEVELLRTIRMNYSIIRTRQCADGHFNDTKELYQERCPECGETKNRVMSSHNLDEVVIRIRECTNCSYRRDTREEWILKTETKNE